MEAQMPQPPSGSGSSDPSSVAYPRWIMLEGYCSISLRASSCSTGVDAKTLAAARTSTGHLIQVSLRLEEPPAASSVWVQFPDGVEAHNYWRSVLAAHGDSVLLHIGDGYHSYHQQYKTDDHFVYNAGTAAADPPRPPSLLLLPPFDLYPTKEEEDPVPQGLGAYALGLLPRRGEDEPVVAGLWTGLADDMPESEAAELCLFRSGQWSVKRLPISYGHDGEVCKLPAVWNTCVPLGDRLLCWVHLSRGVLVICDVFEANPRLQYLRLPMDPRLGKLSNRNVYATAGGRALKFVNVFPRCCCGGAGASSCKHSLHAYTIHTWMMRIDGELEWVKDGIVDSIELWSLDAYKGLPRVPLERPVVTMDEPHVVYFQMCERHGDEKLWLLKVDMKSKKIESVSHHEDVFSYMLNCLILSNVSDFFNSYACNATSDGALSGQVQMGNGMPPVVVVDEQPITEDVANNPLLKPSSFAEPSEQASEIFEALLEISMYGLDGDELKACRILSQDNGRRFRSLLRLPKNLRKDWLLMEIKASQA